MVCFINHLPIDTYQHICFTVAIWSHCICIWQQVPVSTVYICAPSIILGVLFPEFWQISWFFIFRFGLCSVQYACLDLSLVITFWQITLSGQWNWPIRPPKSHPPAGGGFIGFLGGKFSPDLTLSAPTELWVFNEDAIFHMKLWTRWCLHNFSKRNGWKCCPCRSQRPRNVRFSQNVSKFQLQMGWRPSWNYHFH